jgi:sigma-54-interacting transcriptional regulator
MQTRSGKAPTHGLFLEPTVYLTSRFEFRRPEMNREDVKESPVGVRDGFQFEMDMQVAARARVPVLISATPKSALMLAEAIAGRLARADRSIRILACDVADCGGDLGTVLMPSPSETTRSPRASILLLREVHALTQAGQAVLRRLITRRTPEAPRVFASSSVSLYQRVKEGLFDPELFYYLNAVHIVTSKGEYN